MNLTSRNYFENRQNRRRVERNVEEDPEQPELQRPAPEQVQRVRLRRRVALRSRAGQAHQAKQILHPGHSQVMM